MDEKKKHKIWVIVWSVLSILAVLLTLLFMYVVYAVKVKGNPNAPIMVGYWVGFIFLPLPGFTWLYGYTSKLKYKEDKSYLSLYICSIVSIILIFILILAGTTIIPAK